MIHIRKQIIISSIGISLLCSISTNFCMEEKPPKVTFLKKYISIGLEKYYEIFPNHTKKTNQNLVTSKNTLKKDLLKHTAGNNNLVQQTTLNNQIRCEKTTKLKLLKKQTSDQRNDQLVLYTPNDIKNNPLPLNLTLQLFNNLCNSKHIIFFNLTPQFNPSLVSQRSLLLKWLINQPNFTQFIIHLNNLKIPTLKTFETKLLQETKQKRKDQNNAIKEIANTINGIKWKQQRKVNYIKNILQLIEQCKTQFNINECDIGQEIYDNKPLGFPKIDNKKVSVILKIIEHSKQHQSKIEVMYGTREKYLADEMNNFYTPTGNLVMHQVNTTVEHNADALYKTKY